MNTDIFIKIIKDSSLYNFKKMSYKYGNDFSRFLTDFSLFYTTLPLKDFKGKNIVFFSNYVEPNLKTVQLLSYTQSNDIYSSQMVEN